MRYCAVKLNLVILPCLLLALLAGCAEHREYYYQDFTLPREQVFDGMVNILRAEGYEITTREENWVNGLPETFLETDWNMRQTGNPYPGNDVRRRASVKITTIFSERKPSEYQPLDEKDAENMRRLNEEQAHKVSMEHTRVSIAVRGERRSNVRTPLETDWNYEGPDNLEVMALLGRATVLFADQGGRANRPSSKSERLKEDDLRARSDNR